MPITEYPEGLGEGPVGETGRPGGASFHYNFDTGTGSAPGSGEARYNHATPGSATILYISDTDAVGTDLDSVLDSIVGGDLVTVGSVADPSLSHYYRVKSVVDAGDYHTVELIYLGGTSRAFEDGTRIFIGVTKGGLGGLSFPYNFDTDTGVSPAAGEIRYNNAAPNGTSIIYAFQEDANGVDLVNIFLGLVAGDLLMVSSPSNPALYHCFKVLYAEDAGTYATIGVVYFDGSTSAFADSERVLFSVSKRGPASGVGFDYTFDTGTGAGPATGEVRLNHATPASATAIYAHDEDLYGVNIDSVLDTLGAGDLVILRSIVDPSIYYVYEITNNSDAGTYHNLTVTVIAGNGSFSDKAGVILSFSRRGASGAFPLVDVTYKTDGAFDTGSTSFVDVTGASVTWTQVTAGYAKIEVVGSFGDTDAAGTAHDAIMGIQVDGGTDYPLTGTEEHTDGSGNDSRLKPCSGGIVLSGITAGSHTVKVRLRTRGVVGPNAQICATVSMPLRLTVFHS